MTAQCRRAQVGWFALVSLAWSLVNVARAQPSEDEEQAQSPVTADQAGDEAASEASDDEPVAEPSAESPTSPDAQDAQEEVHDEAQEEAEAPEAEQPDAVEEAPVPNKPPPGPCGDAPCTEFGSDTTAKAVKQGEPLMVMASAGWAAALGSARCGPSGIEDTELALRIASTLKQSVAQAGLGIADAGVLGSHPLIEYAAEHAPRALAALLADAGFSVIVIGIDDLNGPLLRHPQLTRELTARGIAIVASNLRCNGQAYCADWMTAEDPVFVVEHAGQRFAFIGILPDDALGRVEPASDRPIEFMSASEALLARTAEARRAHVDLTIASIDHGADPSAAASISEFVGELPAQRRTDLLLHPNSADRLLFLRPLEVRPAIVGTRAGALMALRVRKLADSDDSDILARSMPLLDPDPTLVDEVRALGKAYCRLSGWKLAGAKLASNMNASQLIELAAGAARKLTSADVAVLDPAVFDDGWSKAKGAQLQRGEAARALRLNAPLVVANVERGWIDRLLKQQALKRPLHMTGVAVDNGNQLIAGRPPMPDALYRVVTTSAIVRSGRLPDGADWSPVHSPHATVRGALLALLATRDERDPRERLFDPRSGTQWLFRADGELRTNVTFIHNPADYDEPTLKVDPSRQVVLRSVIDYDADAPDFLFENHFQVAYDRNYATKSTAQDLMFLQTTYTYRGLWTQNILSPHPFAEGYIETQFERGDADYHHLLLRPEVGLRSSFTDLLSIKLSAGAQYDVFAPDKKLYGGMGAELLLKPWTIDLTSGILQLEGNVLYYWNAPGTRDQHTLRGQFIAGLPLIGRFQLTVSLLSSFRDDRHAPMGTSFGVQLGVRLRYVDRWLKN